MERWNDGEYKPLEGHALSWPDATKRVPPDCWPFSLSVFQYSNIPLFLFKLLSRLFPHGWRRA